LPDHVHLLLDCDLQFGINRLVRSLKGRASRILRQEYPFLKSCLPSLYERYRKHHPFYEPLVLINSRPQR
jgi:REP element-mobilizing transposase RayT